MAVERLATSLAEGQPGDPLLQSVDLLDAALFDFVNVGVHVGRTFQLVELSAVVLVLALVADLQVVVRQDGALGGRGHRSLLADDTDSLTALEEFLQRQLLLEAQLLLLELILDVACRHLLIRLRLILMHLSTFLIELEISLILLLLL